MMREILRHREPNERPAESRVLHLAEGRTKQPPRTHDDAETRREEERRNLEDWFPPDYCPVP